MNMRRLSSVLPLTVFLVASPLVARAQTQADVDAQKLRADLLEQQKRESDAKAAIAKNTADEATAAAASKAKLAKDEADAAKAKADYYQSLIPDPAKYKIAEVKAPKVAATANKMAYDDTTALASIIVTAIENGTKVKAPVQGKCATQAAILPEDASVRTLMTVSRGVRKTLPLIVFRLQREESELGQAIDDAGKTVGGAKMGVAGLSAVGELALSLATILKPQYAFETASGLTVSDAVLRSKVAETLAKNDCFNVIDSGGVLYALDGANGELPPELKLTGDLESAATSLRKAVVAARAKAAELRDKNPKPASDKDKKAAAAYAAAQASAAALDARAKTAADSADEAEKTLTSLFTVDAQGGSPIDNAIRGGVLMSAVAKSPAYTLTVKSVASDIDAIAKDSLFSSLKVSVSSRTIAKWQLTNSAGRVVSAGAADAGDKSLKLVKLAAD